MYVAIQAGNLDVINEMLKYADTSVINMCDDQQRTSLHMASAEGKTKELRTRTLISFIGYVDIINKFLKYQADSHVCDTNE
jgi:hypothetical protein